MLKYVLQRVFWMLPTLFGITLVCFVIINLAPGSPVEQALSKIRFSGHATAGGQGGVSDEVIAAIKKQYGMDKPIHIRYLIWLKNIVTLDFGDSFKYQRPVLRVIADKLPVSLQF